MNTLGTPIKKKNNTLSGKNNSVKDALNIVLASNRNTNIFQKFKDSYNNQRLTFNHRNKEYVNPSNLVYFDHINNRVYKIGKWFDKGIGIKNEYLAYKKLGKNDHTPEMIDCKIIPNSEYAMLVITFKKGLSQNTLIQKRNNNQYKEAVIFLKEHGIEHNDLIGNVYNVDRNFFIIDFENITIKTNSLNKTNNKKFNEMCKTINNFKNKSSISKRQRINYGFKKFPKISFNI